MDLKLTIDLSIIAISLNRYILLMFTSNRFLTDCLLVKPADKTILKIRNLSAGQVWNNSVGSLGNGNIIWACLDGLVEPPVGAVHERAVPAQHLSEAVLLAPTRVAGILMGEIFGHD